MGRLYHSRHYNRFITTAQVGFQSEFRLKHQGREVYLFGRKNPDNQIILFDYPEAIRKVIYTINATGFLNLGSG